MQTFNYKRHATILIIAGLCGFIPTLLFAVMNHFSNFGYIIFYVTHCILTILSGVLLRKGSSRGIYSLVIVFLLFVIAFFLPAPPLGDGALIAWSTSSNLFIFSTTILFQAVFPPVFIFAGLGNIVFLVGSWFEILNLPCWKRFVALPKQL